MFHFVFVRNLKACPGVEVKHTAELPVIRPFYRSRHSFLTFSNRVL